MKKSFNTFACVAILILFSQIVFGLNKKMITSSSVDNVKIGMTVADLRRALLPMTMSRTTDGEGTALIAVKEGNKTMMTLYAGENDSKDKINEKAKIISIEVWSPCYKTTAGVHVGMPLKEVEAFYGKLKGIYLTEIESREYAEFEKLPKDLSLRVYGKNESAGIYSDDSRKTQNFRESAYVASITVH